MSRFCHLMFLLDNLLHCSLFLSILSLCNSILRLIAQSTVLVGYIETVICSRLNYLIVIVTCSCLCEWLAICNVSLSLALKARAVRTVCNGEYFRRKRCNRSSDCDLDPTIDHCAGAESEKQIKVENRVCNPNFRAQKAAARFGALDVPWPQWTTDSGSNPWQVWLIRGSAGPRTMYPLLRNTRYKIKSRHYDQSMWSWLDALKRNDTFADSIDQSIDPSLSTDLLLYSLTECSRTISD